MTLKQGGYWVVLTISLIIGYAVYQQRNNEPAITSQDPSIPDIVITGSLSKHYKQNGELSYTLSSPKIKHYQENGHFTFDHPQLIVYGADFIAQWSVNARQAVLDTEKNITLEGAVTLKSLQPESNMKSFKTNQLLMNLTTQEFYSDSEVTLLGETFQIKARALKGNLIDNTIKLYQQVEGQYDI